MPRYTFGSFLLDTEARALSRDGEAVPLAGKTFETLVVLVENRGRLVDKDELLSRVWPGIVVEEANLSQAVFTVRKILGDTPKDPRYIATVAGRGYQFVAPVTELNGEAPIKRDRKALVGSLAALAVLAALAWFLVHRPPKLTPELIQKRLTFNSSENPVQSAAISPDGKYLAYSDPAGIHVKLLSTTEERLIPRPQGVSAGAYWDVSSWFPDGTQLLVDAHELGGQKSMWLVSVLGQLPRRLREDAVGLAVSPDGTHIAFSPVGASDNIREIWVMGLLGDSPQKIFAVGEHEWLQCVRWSPDGRRFAYIRNQGVSDRRHSRTSIETCGLKGVSQTVVVPADRDLWFEDFCWLPEGRMVYARPESLNSSDDNFWQIAIDNNAGTPVGKPKRITQWAGSNLGGFSASADGKRIVLLKKTTRWQVYLGELAAGGTRIQPPRRLTNGEADEWPTAWTADSKAIFFLSDRNGTEGIYKQAISQEIAEPVFTGPQSAAIATRLSPDGAWVLFVRNPAASPNPAPPSLMRIPVIGGAPEFVMEARNSNNIACARAPASLCVIFERSPDRKHLSITAFDPLKGRGKVLRTIEGVDFSDYDYASALSPDGSTFAISRYYVAEIHIQLLSLQGGFDRDITVKGWPSMTGLDWSIDGKGFYCGSSSPRAGTLLYVDLNGNARVLWQYKGEGTWGVPSPDGRFLAIKGDVRNSNVWMLEGL